MSLRTSTPPGDLAMPLLGLGTWRMGEDPAERAREIAAIRLGIDLGMTLIDTAEMYADAESVVGGLNRGFAVYVFSICLLLL